MPKSKRRFYKRDQRPSSAAKAGTETLKVKIEKIIPGGLGLGFAENLTVLTALACPGDELLVRVRERKGKTAFAEIVEIIKPSPVRITPACQYFGTCGGCDFQQLNYAAQLEAKANIIRDCFSRIGKISYEPEIEIIASPAEFAYRLRAQFHADTRRRRFGYFKRHSNQVIDIEECPILVPDLQKTLAELRQNLSWTDLWSEIVEIETSASGGEVSIYSTELIEPTEQIVFKTEDDIYHHDAQAFFQGNAFLIEKLIAAALDGAAGETAVELFSGVGLFTLPLARQFAQVYAVEASENAARFAVQNVSEAHLQTVKLFNENTSDWFTETELRRADFVLLDPPRTGADAVTIQNIIALEPAAISYVSCDPATLARDLRIFLDSGYAINSVTAIDLFPQTHHVETVVRLAQNL